MTHKKKILSDQELIEGIRSGGTLRERSLNYLFDHWTFLIPKMCSIHKIHEEEAKDAYSDAVLALYQQIKKGDFQGKSKLSTYLYRIFYNKCVDILRKSPNNETVEQEKIPELRDESGDIMKSIDLREDFERTVAFMERLGSDCKEVLLDALFWQYNMEEIAKRQGLKDAAHASERKYRCLQKLRKMIGIKEKK